MSMFIGKTVHFTGAHGKLLCGTRQGAAYQAATRQAWSFWTVEDAGDGAVFLVNGNNLQLGSREDGTTYLTGNRQSWERWFIEADGNKFIIRSAQFGKHLGAHPDGTVYTHTNRADWEQWSIKRALTPPIGRTLFFTSAHGKQLSSDGNLYQSTNELAWEQWRVEDAGRSAVFLVDAHGKQMGSRDDGSTYTSPNTGPWERWYIDHDRNGLFVLQSAQFNKQLGARPDGAIYTGPNRDTWERWLLHESPLAQVAEPLVGQRLWLTHLTQRVQVGSRPEGTVYVHSNHQAWEAWRLERASGNEYYLVSEAHGKALNSDSAGVLGMTTNRDSWERWRIEVIGDAVVRIVSVAHNRLLALDPAGQLSTSAAPDLLDLQWKLVRATSDPNAVTINGLTLTLDQVGRFAPVIYFHSKERYLPASIDWLLARAKLLNKDGAQIAAPVTQNLLYMHASSGARLVFDASAYPGEGLDSTGAVRGTMYVVPQVPPDRSFVDLNFIFLHGYNGAQTARYASTVRQFDCALPEYAVHQGDIECVTVRVTPGFNEIIFVRYEAHGDSIFYSRSQVEYLPQTTRPIVLSAYNSHGCWNPADGVKIKDGRIALDRAPSFLTFVDIVERGRVWRNYPLAFAGLDETGEPINDQRWARFAGRLGVQRYNVYTRPEAIGGGSLSSGEHSDVNSLMQLGEVIDALFSSLPSERHDGEGPGGLAGRPIAQTRRPYWVWPPPLLGVHRGGRDDDMWWCTFGARPGAWSEDLRFTQGNKTGATPAIARLGSTIYCVHNGSGDSDLWWCTFDRVTEKWSEDQRFTRGNRSAHGVALAVLDGTLYCVHRGSSDADLWWCVFDPNTRTWSEDQRLPDHCSAAAPALAVLNGVLYCVHRGASDTDLWWCRFNPATKQWSQAQRFTQGNQCGSGPGLAAHEGRLYCVHAGARDPYLWWCVFDPTTNSWSQDRQFTNGNVIGGDAALAIVNGVLYCAHSGHRDGYLWFCTFDPRSQTWSEDARFGRDNQGSFGVGLLVNPFA